MKLGRASWHEDFVGDGNSSHIGESSHTAFPELRSLPKNARLPIRKFLQEQLSKFQGERDISKEMWLLAEAVKELGDDDEGKNGEKEDPGAEGAGGTYSSTILHIACAVGSYWLVKLQIEAGVDVFALDQHSWTALMIATAKGHTSCANLLSEHMKTSKVKTAPKAFPPSGLVREIGSIAYIDPENDSLSVPKSHIRSILITSNHPIPPHFETFYYEIEVLSGSRHY